MLLSCKGILRLVVLQIRQVDAADVGVHPVTLRASDAFGFVRLGYDITVRNDELPPEKRSFSGVLYAGSTVRS